MFKADDRILHMRDQLCAWHVILADASRPHICNSSGNPINQITNCATFAKEEQFPNLDDRYGHEQVSIIPSFLLLSLSFIPHLPPVPPLAFIDIGGHPGCFSSSF